MIPSLVVVGVPDSGKSSFISALSHILEFDEIERRLKLVRLPDDGRYLLEMRNEWEDCQPFERTKAGLYPIDFSLEDSNHNRVDLSFPDIAGEEFDRQWDSRRWSEDFRKAITNATGVLLFVNIQTFRKPFSKADEANVRQELMELGDEDPIDDRLTTEEMNDPGAAIARMVSSQVQDNAPALAADPSQWKPEQADEQAKLVDILQGIVEFAPSKRWRLGVVVSAWEIEANVSPATTPSAWVKRNVRFLQQYLDSNPESFDYSVFGVSAQGGNTRKAADVERLRRIKLPSERVLVVTDMYQGHDLTEIITWMMGLA